MAANASTETRRLLEIACVRAVIGFIGRGGPLLSEKNAQSPNVLGSRSIFQSRSDAIAVSQLGTTQAEPSACPVNGGPVAASNAAAGSTTARPTAVTNVGRPTASTP